MVISGLPFNVSDEEVRDYVARFGGKLKNIPPEFCKIKDGPWKGQFNGERRYKVDISGQKMPMGSFHIIGGTKVKITYRGNTSTCGRCQAPPSQCPGGGIAGRCRDNGGPMVPLGPYIRRILLDLDQEKALPPPRDPPPSSPPCSGKPWRCARKSG